MAPSSTPPRRARANSLITLMCETAGIEAPGEDAYTTEPPKPLTEQETQWVKKLIHEIEGNQQATIDSVHSSDTHEERIQEAPQPSEKFICPTCKKSSFKDIECFRRHLRQVHIGTRCYWPGCAITTATEARLNEHLRGHNDGGAPQSNGLFRCNWPDCGRDYKTAESLARHTRSHIIKARQASETA
ncbi:hypothetical protein F5Y13DRAFT_186314 [Hypoxylon sp. FL1857]|nr:hypothetical protein F5Y13DRAFT_186314 [Hypoxylon sp. FL1857]